MDPTTNCEINRPIHPIMNQMPAEQDAHPVSVNGRLAAYLSAHRQAILDHWLERLNGDAAIPTESLTKAELKLHLPQILDNLIKTLLRYGSEAVAEQATQLGEVHGATRWHQGFVLPEMLREIMHLRSILIYYLRTFEEMNEEYGMVSRFFVTSTVHRFLDELGIDATQQFIAHGLIERKINA
jgi:RsbT co-antagonist protein rsbRD N-terminal domain